MLSKEALWNALREYPEAKKRLIEKGRQLLMKDRLLEDWAMTGEVTEEIKTEERIKKLESMLNEAQTRLARLIASFKSIHHQLLQRLERLDELTASCHARPTSRESNVTCATATYTDASDGQQTDTVQSP